MSDESKLPEVKAKTDGSRQAGKTILIWSAFGVTFGLVYSMMSPSANSSWTMSFAVAGGIAAAAIILSVVMQLWNFRRIHAESDRGIEALGRGDLKAARDVFWSCAEKTRSPVLAGLTRHNLAWTLMRLGELEEAVRVLQQTLRLFGKALHSIRFHATSMVDLALDQALLGNIDEAEKSLALADESAAKGRVPAFHSMRALTRAVIDCRSGNELAAAKAIDEGWTEFEVASTGEIMRLLRVVRAFARSAAGPREAGVAVASLDGLRPAYLGEFEFLGVSWPEMAQFLASHQLVTATTAARD